MDLQVTWANGFQGLANVTKRPVSDVAGVLDSLSDLKKTLEQASLSSKLLGDKIACFFAGSLHCSCKYILLL